MNISIMGTLIALTASFLYAYDGRTNYTIQSVQTFGEKELQCVIQGTWNGAPETIALSAIIGETGGPYGVTTSQDIKSLAAALLCAFASNAKVDVEFSWNGYPGGCPHSGGTLFIRDVKIH